MDAATTRNSISRREALGLLAASSAGLLGGCAPVARFVISRPRIAAADQVLQAFVATVVPGSGVSPNLIRAFADPFYSFADWRSWFTGDLCRRSTRCGQPTFDLLSARDRTRIVADGLVGDPISRRVYTGAVFLAQISAYVPLYEARGDSPLLDFEGTHRFRGIAAITYPEPERFLAASLTCDGNWA